MLTISKPLSAGQARSYHEKEFANAEQNYYSQKGSVQNEWTGKLAAEWGLEGAVTAAEFERLAYGQHPATLVHDACSKVTCNKTAYARRAVCV